MWLVVGWGHLELGGATPGWCVLIGDVMVECHDELLRVGRECGRGGAGVSLPVCLSASLCVSASPSVFCLSL